MKIALQTVRSFAQRMWSGIGLSKGDLEVECDELTITELNEEFIDIEFFYTQDEKGEFKILQKQPKEGEFGTLSIQIQARGIFGGPYITLLDKKGDLLQLSSGGSEVSLNVHLPVGGVTVRDGVGQWSRSIDFSAEPHEDRLADYPKDAMPLG